MRAIGYIRHREGRGSPEDLQEEFETYCHLSLHQPMRMFVESGPTAASGEHAHPEYRALKEFLRDSASDYLVVVPDAGHLGDDLEAVTREMVDLERAGTRVRCYEEDLPDPLQNALITLGVKGVSQTRSDRIKESMRARAIDGRALGKPPYGYRRGSDGVLEIVPDEARVVELIFRLYTKDELGLRLIAAHLNERDILTRRSGRWNMVTIRYILRNPVYIGTYTRFGLRVPKSHEPIVGPEVFRKARDRAQSRRPVGRVVKAEPFLLSGLASCGYCGNTMMGVTRRQSWKRKDGRRARGVYRYYQCQSRNNLSTCGYHTWRAALLEGSVLDRIKQELNTKADQDSAPFERTPEVQDRLDSMAANAERRLVQATKRAARGEISINTLGGYLDEMDDARRRARDSTASDRPAAVLEGWESLPMAERHSFLREHVDRIVVTDDSVDVTL